MNDAQTETRLVLPGQARGADGFCTLGYICRAALALFCTLGFVFFIADALSLIPELSAATAAAIIATVLFSFMGISKRFFFAIGGISAAALTAVIWLDTEKIVRTLYLAYAALWNAFFFRLDALGYAGMKNYTLNISSALNKLGMSGAEARRTGFVIVTVAIAAVFCACILRRVRIIPMIALGSAICTLILYYGMIDGNFGFAMIASALCGVLALAGYDRIFAERKAVKSATGLDPRRHADRAEFIGSLRQSSALGGFAGLGAALLALAAVIIPSGVKSPMQAIPAIAVPAAKLENFFVSLVNGQSPDVGSLIFSGVTSLDSRTTASNARSYTGEHIFTVGADVKLPVYLRSWVGTDYYGDSWHTPGYDRISDYKSMFGEDFSPERLTYDLLTMLNPEYFGLPEGKSYISHTELGFVTARVDLRKIKPTANLIFLPSYTDLRSGLLKYGSLERSQTEFSSYSDGIFTSTGYLFLDDYSVVANLPLLRDPDFARNLYTLVSKLNSERKIIARAYYNSDIRAYADSAAGSLSYRFLYDMDADERAAVLDAFRLTDLYRVYVYDTYLGGCEGFERIENLARAIVFDDMTDYSRMDIFSARHTKIMKIIEYLSENMTYSLAPEKPDPDRDYFNAAETFLFDTKEGYCVQFATAATMLVRALGIPARYAEGYIADSFERVREEELPMRYKSTVIDRNAHAWIEVYYDGYGWVQYEATTPYMSDMYEGYIPTSTEPEPTPADTEPIEYIPEETDPIITPTPEKPAEQPERSLPAGIIAIAVAAAVIAAIVIILRARAGRAERLYSTLAARAASDDTAKDAAKELDVRLFRLLKLYGLVPAPGEQQSDFAARVDSLLGSVMPCQFAEVSRAVLAVEFAPYAGAAEAKPIAAYFSALRAYSLRGTGFSTGLWRKYILAI